jgi:hypothetical protein
MLEEIINKNDLCKKKYFTRKEFQNVKLFLKLPIIWLGISEIKVLKVLRKYIKYELVDFCSSYLNLVSKEFKFSKGFLQLFLISS